MDKTTRAELIAALVMDRHSGFKAGDEALLETAADARLEEFRAAADVARTADAARGRLESENRNVGARLKVAEDRIRVLEAPMTAEDFLARAPQEYKAILEGHKAEEDQLRASLVSQLKDLGANTETELKAKTTPELVTLAKYARVQVPDFSGRGLPAQRNAQETAGYAPPNPYEAGLKALQGAATKH